MGDRRQTSSGGRRPAVLDLASCHAPDQVSMLAALRVVLGLPKQLPPGIPDDLLSGSQLSHSYVPDRTDPTNTEGRGQEDEA